MPSVLPTPADASAQTVLSLGSNASPSVFTAFLARLGDIATSSSVAVVDVSSQTDVARRKLATLLDSGTITANLYWQPTSVQDEALLALYRTAPPVLRSWQLEWPDGQLWLFNAWLTKFAPASKIADALRSAFELTIDGQIITVG